MRIYILYNGFYDFQNKRVMVGGIQTYILNLSRVIEKLEIEAVVVQQGKTEDVFFINPYVKVICLKQLGMMAKVREIEKMANHEKDILIFATSTSICKTKIKHTIGIQHGIYWDTETIHGVSNIPRGISTLLKLVQAEQIIWQHKAVEKMVCVDYNYINWLRAITPNRRIQYKVIPNFADTSRYIEKIAGPQVKIVFARRFNRARGSEIVCESMPRLLQRYSYVSLTVAGSGPDEKNMRSAFSGIENVEFTSYQNSDGVEFHRQFDIAIIPSIASEGTSLSLLEAMSAGCAVVCSDVGGMSNIVLDRFNGRIVQPTANEFFDALSELIENQELCKRLGQAAQKTVKESFSYERWGKAWEKILLNFQGNEEQLRLT